jgi:hypothetical protein
MQEAIELLESDSGRDCPQFDPESGMLFPGPASCGQMTDSDHDAGRSQQRQHLALSPGRVAPLRYLTLLVPTRSARPGAIFGCNREVET